MVFFLTHWEIPKLILLVSCGYAVGLAAMGWLLSVIWAPLPPVAYMSILWYDDGRSILTWALLAAWIVRKMFVLCYGSKEQKANVCVTPWREVDAKPLVSPTVVSMGLVLVMMWVVQVYSVELAGVASLFLIMMLSQSIPGAGGNSTSGVLSLIVIAVLSLVVCPPVFSQLLVLLKDMNAPPAVLSPPNVVSGAVHASAAMLDSRVDFSSILFLDPNSFLDMARLLLGNVVIWWVLIDDWLGPGKSLDAITALKTKGDMKVKGMASLAGGSNWVTLIANTVFSIYTGRVLGAMIILTAGVVTYGCWKAIGEPTWIGRGQGACVIEGRPGLSMAFGDGPIELRVFVCRFCLLVAITLFCFRHFNNVGFGILLLTVACFFVEKWMAWALALVSGNWSLAAMAFLSNPFTGSLLHGMRDAYQPVLGANANAIPIVG